MAIIDGTAANDLLRGTPSNDLLSGWAGSDTLFGGAGNDSLRGGERSDWLNGGVGDDVLFGGAGADTFIFASGTDTITDWNRSEGDVLNLGPALSGYDPASDDIGNFVRVSRTGSGSAVFVDADGLGDGQVNFQQIGVIGGASYANVGVMLDDGALVVPTAASSRAAPQLAALAAGFQSADGTAQDFMEFLGVNIKIEPNHMSYRSSAAVIKALNYLNIENVRTGVEATANKAMYDSMADAGIDFNLLIRRGHVSGGKETINYYKNYFKDFIQDHPGSIKSFEGLNEVGTPSFPYDSIKYSGLTGKSAVTQYQKDFYSILNSDPALRDIPVYNFTVWFAAKPENVRGFGDVSNFADAATAHTYFTPAVRPYYDLADRLNNVKVLDGNSLPAITETGLPSSPVKGNVFAANQNTQAKMVLNVMMDAYAHNAQSLYFYELFDSGNNASDTEHNFGLFKMNGAAKTSAVAIHNFTTIIEKNVATGPSEVVGYDLRNEDSNTHSIALTKAGGITDLVIWREDTVWDPKTQRDIYVAPRTVQVAFDQDVNYVDVYDPLRGTERIARFTDTDLISVQVSDHPIILEIDA